MVGPPGRGQRELLIRMRDAMTHRGPDAAGVWWSDDGTVGLAHRRLAVLDLSPAAGQPMTDTRREIWVTFNGEIFNHRELRRCLEAKGHHFATDSDTEVLLAAYRQWGDACLDRLHGMFVFGLFDSRSRRIFAARDRAGEKPLFYAHADGRLVFASELKALLQDPARRRSVDPAAFDAYLAYGYVPGDGCIIEGVRKLPPGHSLALAIDTGVLTVRPYWTLPQPACVGQPSLDDLGDELDALLRESVRRQLAADVPVGILLSGGVDSSLVAACAAREQSSPVRTFTVRFPDGGALDEGPFARLVADHFGTDHTELIAEPASVELLPLLARQFDEPIADSSMVPTYLVTKRIREVATVALGGDGADELFGGYPHYSWLTYRSRAEAVIPRLVRHGIGSAAGRIPAGTRGRNHLIGLGDPGRGIAQVNLYFDEAWRRRLSPVLRERRHSCTPEEMRAAMGADRPTLLQQATATDFLTTLPDGYLVKTDRASMLNSLELRAPWLDHRIIEFAFARVPDSAKVRGRERKILPRVLAARHLPPTLDLRRKQGFSMPLDRWFKGDWGTYIETILRDADPAVFDPAAVCALVAGQRRGFANTGRLFSLAMFELWRREYRVMIAA